MVSLAFSKTSSCVGVWVSRPLHSFESQLKIKILRHGQQLKISPLSTVLPPVGQAKHTTRWVGKLEVFSMYLSPWKW